MTPVYSNTTQQVQEENKTPHLGKKPTSFMMRNQESNNKIQEDLILSIQVKTNVQNVVTPSTKNVLNVQQASTNARFVINLTTSAASVTRRKIASIIKEGPLVHPRHNS